MPIITEAASICCDLEWPLLELESKEGLGEKYGCPATWGWWIHFKFYCQESGLNDGGCMSLWMEYAQVGVNMLCPFRLLRSTLSVIAESTFPSHLCLPSFWYHVMWLCGRFPLFCFTDRCFILRPTVCVYFIVDLRWNEYSVGYYCWTIIAIKKLFIGPSCLQCNDVSHVYGTKVGAFMYWVLQGKWTLEKVSSEWDSH